MVEEKDKRGREKGEGQGLVESGLELIFPGVTVCQPEHLALDMIVGTVLGGNRNYMCSEILLYMQVGYENFSCPNATKRDPMGPFWDRPLPHIPCFSSSLKCIDNSI